MNELRIDVREAGELALVNVGDDQLVRRGQHGLGACKELVEVLCSFATLKEDGVEGTGFKNASIIYVVAAKLIVNSH